MDKSIFLCNALNPPELPDPPIPVDTRCAMTGRPINSGYPVSDLVTDATSQPHEIFKFPTANAPWYTTVMQTLF